MTWSEKGGRKVPLLRSKDSILEYFEIMKIKISELDKPDKKFFRLDLILP